MVDCARPSAFVAPRRGGELAVVTHPVGVAQRWVAEPSGWALLSHRSSKQRLIIGEFTHESMRSRRVVSARRVHSFTSPPHRPPHPGTAPGTPRSDPARSGGGDAGRSEEGSPLGVRLGRVMPHPPCPDSRSPYARRRSCAGASTGGGCRRVEDTAHRIRKGVGARSRDPLRNKGCALSAVNP
jgi:hypothetical protein